MSKSKRPPPTDGVMAPKAKPVDYRKLFIERLRYEDKYEAYRGRIRQKMIQDGATSELSVVASVMREFGIKPPNEERRLAAERGSLALQQARLDDPPITDQIIAGLGLPHSAPFPREVDWVCAHPLMVLAKDKGNVEIKLSHINNPPHGRAPSIHAVSMLAYYLTKPGEFHGLLSRMSKDQAGQSSNAESDRQLSEIARMVRELTAAN